MLQTHLSDLHIASQRTVLSHCRRSDPKHIWACRLCAAMGLGGKAQDGIKQSYEPFHLPLDIAYQSFSSATRPLAAAANSGAAEGAECPSPLDRFSQMQPEHVIVDLSPLLHKSGWSSSHPEKTVALLLRFLWPALRMAPPGTTVHVSPQT